MDKEMKVTFMEAFDRVFDRDGIMKRCFTNDTVELAYICKEINPKRDYCERDPWALLPNPVLVLHREILRQDLKASYEEVFDEKGNVKNCGKKKRRELIELCDKINPLSAGLYGNKETGSLNVEAIKLLKERYLASEEEV